MDKGTHIIPLVPGGVPVIIHASQDEYYKNDGYSIGGGNWKYFDVSFRILTSDNIFYEFLPPNEKTTAGDKARPADLFYVRPDGVTGFIPLELSRGVQNDNGKYSKPYDLYIRDFPKVLTEVAGDVECQIVLYRGSNPDNRRESSAKFIIRVEPKIAAQPLAHYTINGNTITERSSSDKKDDETPFYYSGDAVDDSLVSWADVVNEANNGDLTKLLSPGQEIRAEMLSTGQYMGIRCIHVSDYKTAFFESKYLFRAPKTYEDQTGIYAARWWAAPVRAVERFYAPLIMPYSIKSVATPSWISVLNVLGEDGIKLFQGNKPTYTPNAEPCIWFDYFKTAEGRIHKTPDGISRKWVLRDRDTAYHREELQGGGATIVTDADYGNFGVAANGDVIKLPEDDDYYYIPLFWSLRGKGHDIPDETPIDIQSWQDVKTAAAAGKLKNSNLQVGQLMPELPTVGVLRCVHIEDNYAVFDSESMKAECLPQVAQAALNSEVNAVMTDEEKDIFTALSGEYYTQPASGTNIHASGSLSAGLNNTLTNMLFDYYADASTNEGAEETLRAKGNNWWCSYNTTWKSYIETSGRIRSFSVNEYTTMKQYLNPIFVVGEIS